MILLTAAGLAVGYANKERCTGPGYDDRGRSVPDASLRWVRDVCYSDIQKLWLGRDVSDHKFPYVNGELDEKGKLQGGVVEYPVLTGFFMWFSALFADNDGEFLLSSVLWMAPFGLGIGWILGQMGRWRALIWALGPPMILYSALNWELPVVACAVGAVAVMHLGRSPNWPMPRRAFWATIFLGFGVCFKLYPGAFVLPLALYVLTRGEQARTEPAGLEVTGTRAAKPVGGYDWYNAWIVVSTAAVSVVLLNVPFATVGFQGWLASIQFQRQRPVDIGTNSIWYWGLRRWMGKDSGWEAWTNLLSPSLVLLSFALACWLGWRIYRRTGVYPWVQVSAAMLCGFLLLHKVHSPQYTLWIVPFFVLLAVKWRWIVAYLIVDIGVGIGVFRYLYVSRLDVVATDTMKYWTREMLLWGVWGRSILLVVLFFLFLRAKPVYPVPLPPEPLPDAQEPGSATPEKPAEAEPADSEADTKPETSAPGEDRLLEVGDPGSPKA